MSDLQKQARITELQAKVIATQIDIEGYMRIEGDMCSDVPISEAINRINSYADELQKIAEGEEDE